jgi:hypothetical protein
MEEAVILGNGLLVRKSFFGTGAVFEFGHDGKVTRFTLVNTTGTVQYTTTVYSESNKFFNYCRELEFNILKQQKKANTSTCREIALKTDDFKVNNDISLAKAGDLIITEKTTVKRNPLGQLTDICKNRYQLVYNSANPGHKFPVDVAVNFSLFGNPVTTDCTVIVDDRIRQFMKNFSDAPYEKAVAGVAEVLSDLKKNDEPFYDFLNDIGMLPVMESQSEYWSKADMNENLFHNYSPAAMEAYKDWLVKYHLYFNYYRDRLGSPDVNTPDKMFIAATLFEAEALKALTVPVKLRILKVMATGRITDWVSREFQGGSREALVVRVVQSVTVDQVDEFLDGLIDVKNYSPDGKKTLFEVLYNKMDDKGIGDANKTAFVTTLNTYWTISKYNPYTGDTFVESRMDRYTYGANAPISLNYQSSEFLGIYTDNFNFKFDPDNSGDSHKILAYEKKTESIPTSPNYGNDFQSYRIREYTVKYGTYNIYQPVSVVDTNFDAVVKMPVIGTGANQKVNNLTPIFMLVYVDEANDWATFKAVVGIFVDVVLTFSGVGNLAKLRYLRYASGLERFAIIVGAIEITASVATIMINIATNNCNNQTSDFCKRFQTYLFWIQLAAGGADLVSNAMLKRSAKRLKEVEPDYPAGVTQEVKDAINAHALGYIQNLVDITKRLKSRVRDRIRKYSSEFTMIHNEQQLNELIEYAYAELRLTERELSDLLYISCRNAKPIPFAEIKLQMANWKNVIEPRGYPFKFNTKLDYDAFTDDLKDLVQSYGVPNGKLKLQGSALRKANPDDLDYAIVLTKAEAEAQMKIMKANYLARNGMKANADYRKYEKNLQEAFELGIIKPNYWKKADGTDILNEAVKPGGILSNTQFSKINISIVIENGRLDISPYLNVF